MKAITIYQPWASLIACGAKRFETRSWKTNYRGRIAIHAGLKEWHLAYMQGNPQLQDAVIWALGGEPDHERGSAKGGNFSLPYGAVIATARLVGCWEIAADVFCKTRVLISESVLEPFGHDEIPEEANEFLFGDWTPARYAWELADVRALPEPIPARGKQGLWEWGDMPLSAEALADIKELLGD